MERVGVVVGAGSARLEVQPLVRAHAGATDYWDGNWHFKGPCRLRDRAGDGNVLLFDIEFDQTDIPAMLDQMRKIESDFPVIGKRAG
jgi:hypothetical protein